MKYSLIIPVYNSEKYIEKCIESILVHSNFDDYEIIIIDDGSTDNTSYILNKFIKDERIKIYRIENNGVAFARNYGLKVATGEFILFIDSDDLLIEDWHQQIENALCESYDFIFFNKNFVPINNSLIECVFNDKNNYLSTPWAKVYKREIIEKYNIKFDKLIVNGEDLIFNLYYFTYIDDYKIVNNSIYKYRIAPNSLTKNYNDRIWESDYNYSVELEKILKLNNIKNYVNIINFEKYNGLFLIIQRIINNNTIKESLQIFNELKYNEKFYDFNFDFNRFNIVKKLILLLFKYKRFKTIILIIKFIKIFRKRNNKEKLITI